MNINKNNVIMGFIHMLVSFSSIVVVTQVVGFNLPVAFLFAGISTIIFHIITKNKIPVVMGVSGLYIGSILYISEIYGKAYAHGGIVVAGLVYIIFALIMFKWQSRLMPLFPDWLLSTTVMLIGLNLLPIGAGLIEGNLLVGLSAFFTVMIIDMLGNKKYSMFSMVIGICIGTLVASLTGYIDYTILNSPLTLEFTRPKFNIASTLAIGLVSIPVIMEALGDVKNTSDTIGLDVFKEVGLGRVLLGNGLCSVIGGLGGSNAYTTYSENTAFVMLSQYYDPSAQIFTGIFLILISFASPISKLILTIPIEAFGGTATYLFSMIVVNSIKQIFNSEINLNNDKTEFIIIITMIGISMVAFTVMGIGISSVSVATIIGVGLNYFSKQIGEK